jgi:hypothetical protein
MTSVGPRLAALTKFVSYRFWLSQPQMKSAVVALLLMSFLTDVPHVTTKVMVLFMLLGLLLTIHFQYLPKTNTSSHLLVDSLLV